MSGVLEYEGCNYLRQRLILSTLSGKSVRIKKIRHKDENPGLHEFEGNLLRLLDTITNGTKMTISVTGTTLFYQPGILHGGKFEHECNNDRSIGYYLEVLLCLAPFCKTSLKATLKGITTDQWDPSVDYYKDIALPLMRQYGVVGDLEIKVKKRGSAPGGGGEVLFQCPVIKKLRTAQITDLGKVKRIRGVAYTTKTSPQFANRLVTSARGVLNNFIPDIYIYTDVSKGPAKSPGFGICLHGETTTGKFLAAESCSVPRGDTDEEPSVPEDVAVNAANSLLEEIYKGGCVDSNSQYLSLLFMALGEQDVQKVMFGPLTSYSIQFLRHIKDFFQVVFKLESKLTDEDVLDDKLEYTRVLLTCVGFGFFNLNKATR
uniref:RNA 3'-terminal phosphate cyclase-like protein n=1 Tax=Phallusia mammillata TaxID=59560 RepID=A0A6F9DQV7_9ASCI|nr:RNA 3'-terminal phosphate cyclase-like protein [Phallusia mammillata]